MQDRAKLVEVSMRKSNRRIIRTSICIMYANCDR